MKIKFADEIVKEMRERGDICVPNGSITGEDFEKWLYEEDKELEEIENERI